jgi:hypothetical protein
MVTSAAGADKYRNASRDIPNKHGYTAWLAAGELAHRSMNGYEKSRLFRAECVAI